MKKNTKLIGRKILLILFPVLFLGFCALAVFSLNGPRVFNNTYPKDFASKEMTEMKKGESLKLSDVNPEYAEFEKSQDGHKFPVRKQSVCKLIGSEKVDGDGIFLDERGEVHALGTGIWELTFTVSESRFDGTGNKRLSYSFVNHFVVYEANEEDYIPWKNEYMRWEPTESYILTEDIELDAEESYEIYRDKFTGIIVNPYGYTITCNTSPALFKNNAGILNGLKIKTTAVLPVGYDAFASNNRGVVKNCSLEGKIVIDPDFKDDTLYEPYSYDYYYREEEHRIGLLTGDGFFSDNTVRVELYTDGAISPFSFDSGYTSEYLSFGGVENNALYIDAYYLRDNIKSRRRNVLLEKFSADSELTRAGNTIKYLDGTKLDYTRKHKVQVVMPGEYGSFDYTLPERAAVDIDESFGNWVLCNANTEVKYWLVNGERYDTLNELRVTEDLTLKPYVKYSRTIWSSHEIRNADETLTFVGGEYFAQEIFNGFLSDPLNVYPKKIVIPKDCQASLWGDSQRVFSDDSAEFLREFIRGGGEFVVGDGHPDMVMLDDKSLCTANGRTLLYYFDEEGQTDFTPHPLIRGIEHFAFLKGNSLKNFDVSGIESFRRNAFAYCAEAESINFGKTVNVSLSENEIAADLHSLVCNLPKLKQVNISEENPDYFMANGAVVNKAETASGGAGTLVYYPAGLTGTLRVPDCITALRVGNGLENGIGADGIEELVLPDSISVFHQQSIGKCKNLQKIVFGSPESLKLIGAYSSENEEKFPRLTQLSFGDIKVLNYDGYVFRKSDVGVVTLPENLTEESHVPYYCAGYEISENNAAFKTADGVLYNKAGNMLMVYPAFKETKEFIVPDGVVCNMPYAWMESRAEKVVFPDSFYTLSAKAFSENKNIRQIAFAESAEGLILDLYSFENCKNLESVTIGKRKGGVEIGDYAFYGCESLTKFTDTDVDSLGKYAFRAAGITDFTFFMKENDSIGIGCFMDSKLTRVEFAKNCAVTRIPSNCFSNTPLERVELGNIKEIYGEAFYNCKSLKKIDLSYVESVGESAFKSTGLQAVRSGRLASVSNSAFKDCGDLTVVELLNVQSVGEAAFANTPVCVVVMNEALQIGASAFENCTNLESASFKRCVEVGEKAFANCGNLTTFEGSPARVREKAFFDCAALKSIAFADTEDVFVGISAFVNCRTLDRIEIAVPSENSIRIGAEAFLNCSGIEILKLSGSNVAVGQSAFRESNLKGVEISATGASAYVTIENSAFSDSFSLAYVEISVTSDFAGVAGIAVEDAAFEGCAALVKVDLSASGVGSSVKLENKAFNYCTSLTEMHIRAQRGHILPTSLSTGTSVEVYLDVEAAFHWEGKVPADVLLYVPEELVKTILDTWNVYEKQVIPYDFSKGEEVA